jgi:hypothetical protein
MTVLGEKHGTLTVVAAKGRNDRGYEEYTCQCDCGMVFDVPSNRLILGYAAFSDGCPKCRRYRRSAKKRGQTSSPQGVAQRTLQGLYRQYIGGAKHRNISWNLELEDFSRIVKQNCHYCGIQPGHQRGLRGITTLVNGIGRMDSSGGYEPGNVVPCCSDCNRAKGTIPYQSFLNWVRRIARFQFEAYTMAHEEQPSKASCRAEDATNSKGEPCTPTLPCRSDAPANRGRTRLSPEW